MTGENIFIKIWKNRDLLRISIRREIEKKYRGTILGGFWVILTPILMSAIYALAFVNFMNAGWEGKSISVLEYGLNIYIGLITFNFIAEGTTGAAYSVINNPNYVKKIKYPLELLPFVVVMAALITWLIGVAIWMMACAIIGGFELNAISLLIGILPLTILALGLAWLVSSVSVYIKDTPQMLNPIFAILLMISPVFYGARGWGDEFSILVHNPLAHTIVYMRDGIVSVPTSATNGLLEQYVISVLIFAFGLQFFRLVKNGFSDVI